MKEAINKLKEVLQEEVQLEETRKPINARLRDLKKIKDGLLEEIMQGMKTDNYSNEFCTIMRNKKLVIEVVDEDEASDFMTIEEVKKVNEEKIEEMFENMFKNPIDDSLQEAEFSGVKVKEIYKPQIRKKKDGL